MPSPLSMDLRQRIVAAYQAGEGTFDDLAARFHVGRATVNRLLGLKRRTGGLQPAPHGGGVPPKIGEADQERLRALVDERKDATAQELTDAYSARFGVQLGRSSMVRALKRAGVTVKKSRSAPRKSTGRTSGRSERSS